MPQTHYIAIDLGAESGRVMLGALGGEETGASRQLHLTECHRFPNIPTTMAGGLRWNIQQLWAEICAGIEKAAKAAAQKIHGISTDSWGVDYVLIGRGSPMLSPPFIYRDPRQAAPYARLLHELGAEFIFANTGIQFMPINTLYQLAAEPRELLEATGSILFIADYFNHLLAGFGPNPVAEISLASTTQLLDVRKRQWSLALIDRVGLPRGIFPKLIESGTVLDDCSMVPGAQVIASCSHDTACAVAAVPAHSEPGWAYISSGTWSLAGVELAQPVVTERCRELGFTNEVGASNTIRLLKNISGLYTLQQCRAAWMAAGSDLEYAQLAAAAENATPMRSLFRPDAPAFSTPGDMPGRIVEYCRNTGQPIPRSPGEFARCIYESLSLLYRKTLFELCELTGAPINRLHIVGGGSRSTLLNQLTANACDVPVIAGPVEAASMGNVLIQARALGHLRTADVRSIVRQSVTLQTFEPQQNPALEKHYERFMRLPVE